MWMSAACSARRGREAANGWTTMRRAAKRNRVLVTGMRKGGDSDYHFRIVGNPASPFPPLILKMSLHEMQQWLRQMQTAPEEALRRERPRLRVVG
jgi:hypothetical protein